MFSLHASEKKLSILHLEDNEFDAELIKHSLRKSFQISSMEVVDNEEDFIRNISERKYDIILADYSIPGYSGLDALRQSREICPDVPFIFVTGMVGDELAVESLKEGATDFVVKESLKRLETVIQRALREKDEHYKLFLARKALLESEKRYQDLYDNAPDIHLSINSDYTIISVNKFGANYLGYSASDMIGKSVFMIIYPDDIPEVDKQLKVFILKKQDDDLELELRLIRKDGSIIWVDEKNHYTSGLEDEPELRIVCRDITQRKKLELQLIRAQKMEAIGTLAGGIAHDFNNILSAILGHTELLKLDVPQTEKTDKSFSRILDAVGRAKNLISRIMGIARQNEDNPKEVLKLSSVVAEVIKLMRSTLPSNITITSDFSEEEGYVEADSTSLHQVFMNLCTNAGYAMRKKGGELDIKISHIKIAFGSPLSLEMENGEYLKVTISDSGDGIEKATLSRIFDPYFTTKPHGEGTGMGLSVVNNIVKSYNGAIYVKSEILRGTVFDIYLPMVRINKLQDKEAKQKKVFSKGRGNILMIDDEAVLTDIGKKTLEKFGYSVTTFNDSVEGLKHFQNYPNVYKLIITDMTMPKMTGDVLALKILDINPKIPVIICTGYSEVLENDLVLSAGVKRILNKPVAIEDLVLTVQEFLGRDAIKVS